LIVIYLIADVGSVGGGWLSSMFIKRGWSVNKARKTAMLICALAVTPIMFVSHVRNLWGAVALIGLAAAAHQGWSANLFTTTSDMFPRRAVGSVVGIGGMAGALGGATLAVAIGYILETTGKNYSLIFFIAGFAYLFALLVIHLLSPRLDQVDDIEAAPAGGAFSIGTFVGFGFMGLILGSFAGWCAGLVLRAAGVGLLKYMLVAGLVSAVLGILAGVVITKSGSRPAAA
jgi:MFS family permease